MDINTIAENLAELLTNTVNMTSVFYDVFLNPNPMYVTLQQYDENNELVTVTIPNRAMDKTIALSGSGTPEGRVEGAVGTAYVDTSASVVYFKVSGNDQYGWVSILDQESVLPIIRSYLVNRGYVTGGDVRQYLSSNHYVTTSQRASDNTFGVVQIDDSSITTNASSQIQVSGLVDSADETKVRKIWIGDEDDYVAITSLDPNTVYILKDSGKIMFDTKEIVAMPFPSTSFSPVDLSSSPGQYYPSFNGYLYFSKPSTAADQYIKVVKQNGQVFVAYATTSGQDLTLNVPVIKGEEITVSWTAAGSAAENSFGFYECKAIG